MYRVDTLRRALTDPIVAKRMIFMVRTTVLSPRRLLTVTYLGLEGVSLARDLGLSGLPPDQVWCSVPRLLRRLNRPGREATRHSKGRIGLCQVPGHSTLGKRRRGRGRRSLAVCGSGRRRVQQPADYGPLESPGV